MAWERKIDIMELFIHAIQKTIEENKQKTEKMLRALTRSQTKLLKSSKTVFNIQDEELEKKKTGEVPRSLLVPRKSIKNK